LPSCSCSHGRQPRALELSGAVPAKRAYLVTGHNPSEPLRVGHTLAATRSDIVDDVGRQHFAVAFRLEIDGDDAGNSRVTPVRLTPCEAKPTRALK
jgi:hypothetical protein